MDEEWEDLMDNPIVVAPPINGTAVNLLNDGDFLLYNECTASLQRCITRRDAVIQEIRHHPQLWTSLAHRQIHGRRLQAVQGLENTLVFIELEIDALMEEADGYIRESPHLYEWVRRKYWIEFHLEVLHNLPIPGRNSLLDMVTQNEMYARSIDLYERIWRQWIDMFRGEVGAGINPGVDDVN